MESVAECGGLAFLMCGLLELCVCVCCFCPLLFRCLSALRIIGAGSDVHMVCVGADAARVACGTAAVVDGCADAAHSS